MSVERMNSEAWRQSVKYSVHPSDDEMASLDFERDLLPAYEARKALWASIKSEMTEDEQAVIAGSIAAIDERFIECDRFLTQDPEGFVPDDEDHTYHKKDPVYFDAYAKGELDPALAYFHACEYPDMCVVHQMDVARAAEDAGA